MKVTVWREVGQNLLFGGAEFGGEGLKDDGGAGTGVDGVFDGLERVFGCASDEMYGAGGFGEGGLAGLPVLKERNGIGRGAEVLFGEVVNQISAKLHGGAERGADEYGARAAAEVLERVLDSGCEAVDDFDPLAGACGPGFLEARYDKVLALGVP